VSGECDDIRFCSSCRSPDQEAPRWLLSAVAGTWPNPTSNANIVSVVANGHVYVASYKQLAIFGFGSTAAAVQPAQTTPQVSLQPAQQALLPLPSNGHEIFGRIRTINDAMLTIETRTGGLVDVDATEAMQAYQSVVLSIGEAVRLLGTYDTSKVFQATVITRVKDSSELWPPDR